jgi:hypothetical protein
VAAFVKPDDSHKDAFWKLYDENFENLSNEIAGDLLKEILALTKKNDKLVASYVKKTGKATSPLVAMQFHQIEMYILSEIRVSIAANVPFPEIIN